MKVIFNPDGKTVDVPPGTSVLEAATAVGLRLNSPCGGEGVCGNCRILIPQNPPPPGAADRKFISKEDLKRGLRLACQTEIVRPLTIIVPYESRALEQKILSETKEGATLLNPAISKHFFSLAPPSISDQRSDTDRIREALEAGGLSAQIPLPLLRDLAQSIRAGDFKFTAALAEKRFLAIEPGDTTNKNFGVAVDLGTTTVVGYLLDLTKGRQLAVAARTNPQVPFGDDVVSRIASVQKDPTSLDQLQSLASSCINEIIDELCQKADISSQAIYELTLVGNTTMSHLFLGINPTSIAQAPYTAVVRGAVNVRAGELGVRISPAGNIYTMPNIAGFLGGDTIGVALSSGIYQSDGIKLAVDVGTNGELLLGTSERLICCSCAAGPAFEGARIACGMRATEGAIERVRIDKDVHLSVLGGGEPVGLCGTGLVDAVAGLLDAGIIHPTGKINQREELSGLPPALQERIIPREKGNSFLLARTKGREPTADGPRARDILLTQRDVRELQLAKGAIFAGLQVLKKELGVSDDDIEELLLAGAFGNYLRPESARRIGLLPPIPSARMKFIGNAAGAGAKLVLLNKDFRQIAERLSQEIEYIELAGRSDFQQIFAEAMLFPGE